MPTVKATNSGMVTYYFQVGNVVDAIDVQNGQVQRSFVRNVDVIFEQDDLDDLLLAGRIEVTKFDLNGENPSLLAASAYSASISGDRLRFDLVTKASVAIEIPILAMAIIESASTLMATEHRIRSSTSIAC